MPARRFGSTSDPISPLGQSARALATRILAGTTAVAVTLSLAGCGSDVELNGKLFDTLGISSAAQKASAREPTLPDRTGLVLPPDAKRLPEPGSGGDGSEGIAALQDPEKKRALAAAERERLHKAYCSGEATWKQRVARPEEVRAASPFGPCTLFGGALKQ